MAVVFKLPDLGENIESAEVVSVAAAVGDTIAADQTMPKQSCFEDHFILIMDLIGRITSNRPE